MSQKELEQGSLRTVATLIRPTEISVQMADDYGLSKVSRDATRRVLVVAERDVSAAILSSIRQIICLGYNTYEYTYSIYL